jgi:hypothetical protein
VLEWRELRLARMGVSPYWGLKIARTEFDIEAACRMLANGCDPETLYEIAE